MIARMSKRERHRWRRAKQNNNKKLFDFCTLFCPNPNVYLYRINFGRILFRKEEPMKSVLFFCFDFPYNVEHISLMLFSLLIIIWIIVCRWHYRWVILADVSPTWSAVSSNLFEKVMINLSAVGAMQIKSELRRKRDGTTLKHTHTFAHTQSTKWL